MQSLERRHDTTTQLRSETAGGPSSGGADGIRQAGEQLFQAADDAIERALSGDSLAFLEATQQDGGQ